MKAFRKQFRECRENGTIITVPIPDNEKYELDSIIVCTKYKKVCSSDICKEERMKL